MKQIFKNKNALLTVLIVGIIAMTVAFAAVSSQLNIFGTAKISSGSYKVVIDDWTQTTTPSLVSGATNTGYQITAASVTSNTMTISGLKVGFKQPGDAVKYTFNIENQGTIDAAIDSFTLSTPTCTNASTSENVTCPGLTYEVKCGSPAATPAVGDNLLAGQTIPCYYYLAYNVVDASSLNQPAIEVGNINASWTYTQKATNSYTPQTTKYKLTLNSMGGSNVSNIEALGGSEITLPEPTKSGYDFDGWYTAEEGGTKITSNIMPTSNTTYYAHWELGAICKKATTLHTETCSSTVGNTEAYCRGANYALNDKITFGHTTLTNGNMTAGYALTCDVNGDGIFNETNERFYYVSDYYVSGSYANPKYDSDYAVLIYYNNTINGIEVFDYQLSSWSSQNNVASEGPTIARNNLPKTTGNNKWRSDLLKTNIRPINTFSGNGTINSSFSYENYAARLISVFELSKGCNFTMYPTDNVKKHGLLDKKCEFLLENTAFSTGTSSKPYSLWTESVTSTDYIWYIYSLWRDLEGTYNTVSSPAAVRPTIEVPYSKIQLQ